MIYCFYSYCANNKNGKCISGIVKINEFGSCVSFLLPGVTKEELAKFEEDMLTKRNSK